MTFRLVGGDAIEAMQAMAENSVDAIVTDPPYGLEFMGKEWDKFRTDDTGTNRHRGERARKHEMTHDASPEPRAPDKPWQKERSGYGGAARAHTYRCVGCGKRDQFRNAHDCPEEWRRELIDPHAAPPSMLALQEWSRLWATEALRILKPGGHLLAFGGTRTYHRLACAIEDAGFEIRDCIAWMYGSGFPKSLDVSKAIDKAAGAEREVVGTSRTVVGPSQAVGYLGSDTFVQPNWETSNQVTAPATPEAQRWNGWGTATKPAWEPVVVAAKPYEQEALWLTGPAKPAASPSEPTPAGSSAARAGSAPAPAATPLEDGQATETPTGGEDGTSSEAATSGSTPGEASTGSNMTSSSKPNLDDASSPENRSTTGTTSSTTTDDPTSNSSASPNMRDGTLGLEPNLEPIVLARKPLSERNVAANVQRWGTGALNIDGCRIEGANDDPRGAWRPAETNAKHEGWQRPWRDDPEAIERHMEHRVESAGKSANLGRWPANVTLDPEAARLLDEQTGETTSRIGQPRTGANGNGWGMTATGAEYADQGGASRFFYCPKADREERNRGLEHMAPKEQAAAWGDIGPMEGNPRKVDTGHVQRTANVHPTVKPVELMRWLCRMVTPKGGTVLDPFTGSGSTGVAALREGFEFVGIEREADYVEIARARIVGDAPLFNVEVDPPNE